MAKKSFEEQFPGYEIIPEKSSRWKWSLIYAMTALALVGLPLLTFLLLSYDLPLPSMAGNSQFSLPTLAQMALTQSSQNQHHLAAQSLERYFALGGQEAEMMALYAFSLKELGRTDEARDWSERALRKDPESKAGRMIRDALKN